MKKTSIALAFITSGVAFSANAGSLTDPTGNNLAVALLNADQSQSFVVELEQSVDDIIAGTNTGFDINLVDEINTDLGMNVVTDLTDFTFGVIGLSQFNITASQNGTSFTFPQGTILSGTPSTGLDFDGNPIAVTNTAIGNAQVFLNSQVFSDSASTAFPGSAAFFDGDFLDAGTVPVSTSVGSDLDAFFLELDPSSEVLLGQILVLTNEFGTFSLDESGNFALTTDNGPIVIDPIDPIDPPVDPVDPVDPIDPPAVIPVPAAVWLFGSAIAGLVGFGRRKTKA